MATSSKDQLRAAGLRVTRPRVAVLDVLVEHPHATVDLIAKKVRATLGNVSKQAVYDVLAVCVDVGLVRRIEPAGLPALFETRIGDNHHHLVCRACGRITDADCATGDRPCLTPSDVAGYSLDEAEVVFWGLCASCQPKPKPAPTNVRSST